MLYFFLIYTKNFVDTSVQKIKIVMEQDAIEKVKKSVSWVFQMLKSTLGPSLLYTVHQRKAVAEWFIGLELI